MINLRNIMWALWFGVPLLLGSQTMSGVEKVLDNLYNANGNKIILKPRIVEVKDEMNAAKFLRKSNVIELSDKVIRVCRTFGKDSSAALAFIFGHELSHAFQLDLTAAETSFLAYDKAENSSELHEEAADISGGFMAYLAGYKTLDIIEPLIEKIYSSFELNDKLSGYPSLEERKKTTAKVKKMIVELIKIYELGNLCTAIGQYDYAISCYEFVSKWYHGKEVYNNIGVNYSLLAMNISNLKVDQYIYPIELNWNTRMKKPLLSRGEINNVTEMALRQEYLTKSEESLIEASRMGKNFFSADLNLMCVYILKGKYKEAIQYYRKNDDVKRNLYSEIDSKNGDQFRLALALAYAGDGDIDKAKRIWTDLAKEASYLLSEQAKYNIDVMNDDKVSIAQRNQDCLKFSNYNKLIDGVKIHKTTNSDHWIKLSQSESVELSIQELPNSSLYTFKSNQGYFNLQRIVGTWKANKKDLTRVHANLITTNGSIYHCDYDKYALMIDSKNNVVEWLKYY